MRALPIVILGSLLLVAVTCKPPVQMTPPPAGASATQVAISGASVMIGVGDIARCDATGDEQTAELVDSVLRADSAAKVHDEVFTMGDNAYPTGSARDFALCFTPSWGDSTKLIMKNIRPSPGNHEHLTGAAAPYYQYFGAPAGAPTKGYYSYDVGAWHAIVLNSEIVVNGSFTSAERQAQEDWLAQDLKSNTQKCTLAYWHHPRFSSGWHGSDPRIGGFWQILHAGGVDLVLNGHDHDYERFLSQTPSGVADSVTGMTQIIAGTGGGDLRGYRNTIEPNSTTRIQGHYGVLMLTLGAGEWGSAFLDVNGMVWDQTSGVCH